ncbi:hypothetical protein RB195_005631 [Necator americanus]|uniref:Uncharacterized protein n=1 Tax=Necator americanus TaxID=51031 RepID=A0ABR1BRY8_NECAM
MSEDGRTQHCLVESLSSPWIIAVSTVVMAAVLLMIITAITALKKVKLFGAGRQAITGHSRRMITASPRAG